MLITSIERYVVEREKRVFFQIESIENIKDIVNPNILMSGKVEEGSKNMTKDLFFRRQSIVFKRLRKNNES